MPVYKCYRLNLRKLPTKLLSHTLLPNLSRADGADFTALVICNEQIIWALVICKEQIIQALLIFVKSRCYRLENPKR